MATEKLSIGSKIPEFNLPATDGNFYSNEASDKDALIVMFSCNHCPYVRAYEDRIMQIQEDYNENLMVLAINANDAENYPDDSFDNMKTRARVKNFNFPYLRDENQATAKAFDATHTPEIFLFDKERKLAYHGKIDDNWQEPGNVQSNYLRDALNEILEGKKVSIPETYSIGCTIKWKK